MDESELSFIRCPNCRSLVPAVASRCRMCGFILKDASNKPPVSEGPQGGSRGGDAGQEQGEERPSRVRQRTISVSGNAALSAEVEPPLAVQAAAQPVEPIAPKPVAPPPQPPPPPPPPPPAPVEEPEFASQDSEQFDDFEESVDEDEFEDEDSAEASPQPQAAGSELVRKKRRRRRRKKKPAQDQAVQTPPAANNNSQPVTREATPQADEGYAPWRTPPSTGEARPGFKVVRTEEPVPQQPVAPAPRVQPEPPVAPAAQSAPVTQPSAEASKMENFTRQESRREMPAGSLVGWLVSFAENRTGVSHELREGRFFVGKEQLRASDFVINHSSVSTPQCLVVCDPVSGVTIQDLMSDRGTTLIRGSSALEKSSEQVRLENGDRIRFGEYEMLFVKLPQVR